MGRIKDKLYHFYVQKNENVRYEYERYVREHIVEHYENRSKHWKILWKLNWHYRIQKKEEPLLFWDKRVTMVNNVLPTQKKEKKTNTVENKEIKKDGGNVCNGAESTQVKLPSAYHFAKSLLKYDVISFDIFDTLLFRPFADPKDLFLLLQHVLQYDKLYELRISSELKARAFKEEKIGNREISIYNIYDFICYETGIEVQRGVETEFELEKKLCFANPYMKEVFDILLGQNKKIILVSDMYYPRSMLDEILEFVGIRGYSDLFVSCDYEANKSSGKLYDIVLAKYKDISICHVGDNVHSDIEVPKTKGISTKYYPNVQTRGNRYRVATRAMSKLIGSAYAGIANSYLWCGDKEYSLMYEFGFLYGGIYIWGYMNWVHDYVMRNNIDKVIFLSRDGYIYSKVFNHFFNDVPNEYIYWSRAVTAKVATDNERDELIKFIKMSATEDKDWIKKSFEALGLDVLLEDLSEKDIIRLSSADREWIDFLFTNWDKVLAALKKDITVISNVIKKVIGNSKKIAIVDVGWNGTSAYHIKRLVNKGLKSDCEVVSLLVGSMCKNGNENKILSGEQVAYAFSANYNRILFDLFKKDRNRNAAIFELFTQAHSPMFKGYASSDTKISFEFFTPNVKVGRAVDEIHEGIFDFCTQWDGIFGDFKLMNNISGFDALNPYRVLASDVNYVPMQLMKYMSISEIKV